jgi:holo-[acyl-carrier protein] synthase
MYNYGEHHRIKEKGLKIYLGTDIVYIPRIQGALEKYGDRFIQRVYTEGEQKDCQGENVSKSTICTAKMNRVFSNRFAGRWAAKEAVVKALGTGWRGICYTEIEIRRLANGAPQVYLHGAAAAIVAPWGQCQWQLSLSHDRDYSVATAIALCGES